MAQVSTASYALFYVNGMLHGIDCAVIESFFILEEVHPSPDMDDVYRGLVKYRDEIIPAIDLRVFLHTQSTEAEAKELIQMIKQRKADHLHWLEALTKSVTENVAFTLTTDPHQCACGKWIDSFKTNDIGMKQYLSQLKKPHNIIHGIAEHVLEMKQQNNVDGALKLIENTRNKELSTMVRLFDSFEKIYNESRREIVIVVSNSSRKVGIVVDKVVSLENLEMDEGDDLEARRFGSSAAVKVGIRPGSSEVVQIFNEDRVLA